MINQPFAVVPALHSVLNHFTHQVTSGYSIVLIRDPARGTELQVPENKRLSQITTYSTSSGTV